MDTEIPDVVPSTPAVVEKVIPIPMDYDKNARKSYNAKTTITILFSFIPYP
jgi:hypothetical protein